MIALPESFFSRFKADTVEGGIFESVEQARSEVFSYIEGYYNRIRRHSSLGYLSPKRRHSFEIEHGRFNPLTAVVQDGVVNPESAGLSEWVKDR
jgi:hypothetical protein